MSTSLIYDTWTALSFKRALGNRKQPGSDVEAPTWVGDHKRRLAAYKILAAYLDNSARHFLVSQSEEERDAHREYGDAELVRDTILGALLGEEQTIAVDGADAYDPDASDDDTGENPTVNQVQARAAWDLQEWLRQQWDDERGPLKMVEVERDAVGLGDGVYSLAWSADKQRVRVRVWDPGFYFPVLDDGNEDDYPDRVHLAWEMDHPTDENKTLIRRLTYILGPIRPLGDGTLLRGDQAGEDGLITRVYPYEDTPSRKTCYFTDATWVKDTSSPVKVDDFDYSRATFATDENGFPVHDLDLGFDFIPVVHVPNTVAVKDHYGKSSLAKVLQILDDLANSDTDAQAASATSARPVMALSGGTLGRRAPAYRPGEVWELGDGTLNLIDTSRSLDAVLKYVEFLLGRLSVNARTPDALLGRIKPSEVPSGVSMLMSFGPLTSMVGQMRLSRDEKYPLLFKMWWRIAMVARAGGADIEVPGTFAAARVTFGSFLPQDKSAAVGLVNTALVAGTISLETAVQMLVAAGLPIEDAVEEVQRIESRDFDGAQALGDATGSKQAVFDYLGRDNPGDQVTPPPAPVIGGPGDPTGLGQEPPAGLDA